MSATSWIACATRSALITTFACSCGRVGFETHADGGVGVLSEYSYRKRITLSHPSPVSDLPVSIVVSDPGLAQHAHRTGTDFAFVDAALQPLVHEVVAYDPDAGALECWVRVPLLAAGTTDLYLYYGGPTRTAESTAVWASFAGCLAPERHGRRARQHVERKPHRAVLRRNPARQRCGDRRAWPRLRRSRRHDGRSGSGRCEP